MVRGYEWLAACCIYESGISISSTFGYAASAHTVCPAEILRYCSSGMGKLPAKPASFLTLARVQRIVICCAFVSAMFLAMDAVNRDHNLLDRNGEFIGRDFANTWGGVRLAASGNPVDVYNPRAFHAFQTVHISPDKQERWYSYPPVALLLSLPLAAFNYLSALILWQLGGLLLCGAILSRLIGWRFGLSLVTASPAFYFNAVAGQNGAFTAALMAGGIMLLEKRPILAGILFGALCFKPQLALLIPIALAGGSYWRTFMVAGATSVLLLLASLAIFGPETWKAFEKLASYNLTILQTVDLNWHRMPSVYVMVRTFGVRSAIAFAVQALASVAAAVAVFKAWKSEAPILLKGSALIIGIFLATPYIWDYDLVVVTFAVVFFFVSIRLSSGLQMAAIVSVMLTPLLALIIANKTGIQIGPLLIVIAMWPIMAGSQKYLRNGTEDRRVVN